IRVRKQFCHLARWQDCRVSVFRNERYRAHQRLSLTINLIILKNPVNPVGGPEMDQKEWTIMIYMAGDNNLAVDMAYAMEQIKGVAGAGPDSPNLFVYYDGNSPAIPTLYCDFSEPEKARYVRSYKVPNKLYSVPKKANEI